MSPGGSVKDRIALNIVLDAERRGVLKTGDTLVEGTGGNTGIGLALVARARGYRTVIVMNETISVEKQELLRTFGAELILVKPVPFTDPENYCRVAERVAAERGAFYTNQFENLANSQAHYERTGPEIWRQSGERVDGFICSAGTGGTIGGVSSYLKERNPECLAYVMDIPTSVLHDYVMTGCMTKLPGVCDGIEGIGIQRITANFARAKLDGAFSGDSRDAVEMAHYLLRHEGLFVGPSAALNILGAVRLAQKLGPGHTVVTVLCDSGDRYRSKVFSAAWQAEKDLAPRASGLEFLEPAWRAGLSEAA